MCHPSSPAFCARRSRWPATRGKPLRRAHRKYHLNRDAKWLGRGVQPTGQSHVRRRPAHAEFRVHGSLSLCRGDGMPRRARQGSAPTPARRAVPASQLGPRRRRSCPKRRLPLRDLRLAPAGAARAGTLVPGLEPAMVAHRVLQFEVALARKVPPRSRGGRALVRRRALRPAPWQRGCAGVMRPGRRGFRTGT
jgi:hypothetical protein